MGSKKGWVGNGAGSGCLQHHHAHTSYTLCLVWNVTYIILIVTVIGWGHHEPHFMDGDAEVHAIYKARLRSKWKGLVEPRLQADPH